MQGAEPPESCMIHTIVYYVGNFIPDGLVLHKFTTMDPSGIKFPAGWHFYYIEETNSHASVYYMNYMGMCYSHQYIKTIPPTIPTYPGKKLFPSLHTQYFATLINCTGISFPTDLRSGNRIEAKFYNKPEK